MKEDHLNWYSNVLEYNVGGYRDTGSVDRRIDMENNRMPGKLIKQCWNRYQVYYRGTASRLLIDIYPFMEGGIKREIIALANRKIKGMEIILLLAFLDRDIFSYSGEIEQVLLDRCQRFSKLSGEQRGESRSIYSPLTHILWLWRNGKIPQIEIFHEYKWLDPWLSFVCFPDEFDYADFEVETWCPWLDEETYRGDTFDRNRELLKDKFWKAMEEGAGEEVRRIYYKYLE